MTWPGSPASPQTPPDPEPPTPANEDEQAMAAEDRYLRWLDGP